MSNSCGRWREELREEKGEKGVEDEEEEEEEVVAEVEEGGKRMAATVAVSETSAS